MSRARGWQRLSLRARLIVIGVLGVAVALAVGSFALYGVLTVVSYRTLDNAGDATAAEVADLVDRDRLPDPIPVTGSQIVQVLDSRNRVVSASVNGDRLTAVVTPGRRGRPSTESTPRSPGRGWAWTRPCASPLSAPEPPVGQLPVPVARWSWRNGSTTSRTASGSSERPCW